MPDIHIVPFLCFHHHPEPINCGWLDPQVIDNIYEFYNIVDRYDNVKVCIYGHIHQDRTMRRKGVSYIASPSTCAQFKPEINVFELDDLSPGYRWLNCFDDGLFATELVRLKK